MPYITKISSDDNNGWIIVHQILLASTTIGNSHIIWYNCEYHHLRIVLVDTIVLGYRSIPHFFCSLNWLSTSICLLGHLLNNIWRTGHGTVLLCGTTTKKLSRSLDQFLVFVSSTTGIYKMGMISEIVKEIPLADFAKEVHSEINMD